MPDQVNATFGQRVNARRTLLGMSMRDLRAASGIAISQISRVERGYGTSLEAAARLAAALSSTLGYLTGEAVCACCCGKPPAGMACQECGAEGPVFAEVVDA